MDYSCAEFGDFTFSCFGFIVRTDRQTQADQRYTHATIVSMSKYLHKSNVKCRMSIHILQIVHPAVNMDLMVANYRNGIITYDYYFSKLLSAFTDRKYIAVLMAVEQFVPEIDLCCLKIFVLADRN